jgi:hypothetical protein
MFDGWEYAIWGPIRFPSRNNGNLETLVSVNLLLNNNSTQAAPRKTFFLVYFKQLYTAGQKSFFICAAPHRFCMAWKPDFKTLVLLQARRLLLARDYF